MAAGILVATGDRDTSIDTEEDVMPHPHRRYNPGPHPHPIPPTVPNPPPATTGSGGSGGSTISYTFADEFDGAAGGPPNPELWNHETGPGSDFGTTGELETYVSSTATCYQDGNSNLVIQAVKTSGGYDSARVNTLGKFAQQGGYFEVRAKLDSQPGCWPAIWMMGADINSVGWPDCGEVDIVEDYGRSVVETTVHTPNGDTTFSEYADIASNTDWHVYRMHWDYEGYTFTFYRDGTQYLTVQASELPATSWVFGSDTPNNGGLYFLLNMAVGGYVGAPPASTAFPVQMLVDYVHAWQ
jgi:beta-glucanase (GH16 family)